MGKNLLVGVGGKARKVKALYVGAGGKARKVKKVYVGVGGKARLVYTSYVAVTGITVTHENLYNHSSNVLNFYVSITPSDATDKSYSVTVTNNDGYGEYKVMKWLSNGFQLYSNAYNFHTKAGCTITITTKDGISKKLTAIYFGVTDGAYWTVTE